MLGDLVNNLDIAIAPFFTTDELDQLARDSQFVKRAGKINGSLFFELLVFHSERLKSESLNDLSVDLKGSIRYSFWCPLILGFFVFETVEAM
jgi:hypothetical protein